MDFSKKDIIPQTEIYHDLNYKQIAAKWWQYILRLRSDRTSQNNTFGYLRSNVEGGKEEFLLSAKMKVRKDMAIFFPILTFMVDSMDHSRFEDSYRRLLEARRLVKNPEKLDVKIDNFTMHGDDFEDYYVEHENFELTIPKKSFLRNLFVPLLHPGSRDVSIAGYFLLLRPPNSTITRRISFDGKASSSGTKSTDGFHTKAAYTVEYVSQSALA